MVALTGVDPVGGRRGRLSRVNGINHVNLRGGGSFMRRPVTFLEFPHPGIPHPRPQIPLRNTDALSRLRTLQGI